jgi:uncharacterized membrane protein
MGDFMRELFGSSWAYLLAIAGLLIWWAGQRFWRK